ncbi:MAG: helix-turn-helix domain-containing protein [Bacteroidota bacterium]
MNYSLKSFLLTSQSKGYLTSIALIETTTISEAIKSLPLFQHPFIIYRIAIHQSEVTLIPVSINQCNTSFDEPHDTGSYLLFLFTYQMRFLINENYNELSQPFSFPVSNSAEKTGTQTAEIIASYLEQRYQNQQNLILEEALELMQKHEPGINAAKIARHFRISSRHLRRLTRQQTGLTPKTIIRLSRLKDTYLLISLGSSVETALFNNGYYDFSHFTKDSQSLLKTKPHTAIADTAFLNAVMQLFKDQRSFS